MAMARPSRQYRSRAPGVHQGISSQSSAFPGKGSQVGDMSLDTKWAARPTAEPEGTRQKQWNTGIQPAPCEVAGHGPLPAHEPELPRQK